jgi:hypothetical protein
MHVNKVYCHEIICVEIGLYRYNICLLQHLNAMSYIV